jgi:hypothetical protein
VSTQKIRASIRAHGSCPGYTETAATYTTSAATPVIATELTSKNANVFYELGLAHAYQKPVVLVSSNTDDVPFDLRHIRVILYDNEDPFWGTKLIDKVADNVRQAIESPEDAIFRAEA